MQMVRFFTSEEVVAKFSWDFCLHFHGTVVAALQEYEDQIGRMDLQQLVSQIFYQSLQRFNTPENIQRYCTESRFMVNTMVDLPTDRQPEPRVKIVIDLVPVAVADALHPTSYSDECFTNPPGQPLH